MRNWNLFWHILILVCCLLIDSLTYAQTPTTQPTKKEIKQQKKALKYHQKEQLTYKADSIKIAAMLLLRSGAYPKQSQRGSTMKEKLQLRNTHEAKQIDSLKRVMKNSKQLAKEAILEQEQVKEVTKQVDPYLTHYKQYKSKLALLDSGNTDALLKDAKQLGLKELSKKEEFKDIKKELSPYLDSPYLKGVKLQDLDSISLDSLKELSVSTFQKLEKRLEQEVMNRDELKEFNSEIAEFEALKGLPESYKKQFEKYQNGEGLQKEALAEAAKKAQALLSKHSKEIQSAQTQLTKLKKKYSSVQSSNDLSTATKRNTLQGKPLKERIVLGINFQIVSLDPVIIDFNPVLGYKFDKKFHVAVGGSYRARFTESHANSSIRIGQDELTYGYRVFTEYNVWKVINIHAEYERISKEFEIGASDIFERKWVEGALAGISSSYTIKDKVQGNFSVLYNFLYQFEEAVYTSPWVFRFGVSR